MIKYYEVYNIYTLSLTKSFTAEHFLPMIEGEEAKLHSHDYQLTIKIEGKELDEDGFLIDLLELDHLTTSMIKKYKGKILNEIESFENKNPTLENFSKILYDELFTSMKAQAKEEIQRIYSIEIILWENEAANASYREEVDV